MLNNFGAPMRFKILISFLLSLFFSTLTFAITPPANGTAPKKPQTNSLAYRSVVTSPIIDINLKTYQAGDVLVNVSSMNEDLLLLKQIQEAETRLDKAGISLADRRPVLEISGKVESQILAGSGFSGSNSDINLSGTELDFHAIASRWASAFVTINYDSSPPETGNRESNSRLYLQRGFLTLGNLNELPVYVTLGQMYVPFGAYNSYMITTPLTTSLARIQTRAGVLGFSRNNFFAQAYAFRGDAYTGDNALVLDNFGGNVGFSGSTKVISNYTIGASYVSDIANSQGMQDNGLDGDAKGPFSGFSINGSQALQKQVPAADVNGTVAFGPLTLIGEYISSISRFNSKDLNFNGEGAKPSAMHTEINYQKEIYSKIVTFGAAYGQTWEALALNLPKQSYSIFASTSLLKNTILGIELRHDVNYDSTNTGGGNGAKTKDITVSGKTRNLITGQIGVYF